MAAFSLEARQVYNPCGSGQYYSGGACYNQGWYYWGRWVLAGVAVICFILLLACCSCYNNRRRRRQGLQPMYGTGWMNNNKWGGGGWGGNQPNGYNNEMYPPPGPPAYQAQNPQYTGTTFNPNDGYYAGHNTGVSYPANTYQREPAFSPPVGPPPPKQ